MTPSIAPAGRAARLAIALAAIALLSAVRCLSQQAPKANFELANKFTTEKLRALVPDQSLRPEWIEKTDRFWYRYKTTSGTGYYFVDPEKKLKKPLFNGMTLAAELIRVTGKPVNGSDLALQNLKFVNGIKAIQFELDSLRYEYDLAADTLAFKDSVKPKGDESWINYSPDSTAIVFVRNHNLFIMKAHDKDSVEKQITADGELFYGYGESGDTTKDKRRPVHVTWSKDSKKFAVERTDERKVSDLWVVHTLDNPRPTLETYKYAMPGDKNVPQAEPWIYDRDSSRMTSVDAKLWVDQTLSSFNWGKAKDRMFFTRKSRDMHKVDICVADAATGKVRVLFEERRKTPIETRQLVVIEDGREFLWFSVRDGWGHYYRYGADGKLMNRLTAGPFMVDRVAAIDTAARVAYLMCNGVNPGQDPYYMSLYRVNFDGSGFQLITPEEATHGVEFSESRKFFVDNYSRVDLEPRSVLRDGRGNLLADL